MIEIYEERFKTRTWDVDSTNKLTIAAAYNYCQEVAGNHAQALGVGADYMMANGIVWILSRMSAVLHRRPAHGDTISVRTWPRGTEKLFAIRDYELRDEAGAVVGSARSAWLIVDAATFRPRRPEALAEGLPTNEGLDALADGAKSISGSEGLEKIMDRSVAYSDLDYNGHMNNARYAQWVQDAVDPEPLSKAVTIRLDINYLAELKPGICAGLFGRRLESSDTRNYCFALEGRPREDGPPAFRSVLSLGKKGTL